MTQLLGSAIGVPAIIMRYKLEVAPLIAIHMETTRQAQLGIRKIVTKSSPEVMATQLAAKCRALRLKTGKADLSKQ